MKVAGIVLVNGGRVNEPSEESVGECILEGVTDCMGDDPEDVAGASNSMD